LLFGVATAANLVCDLRGYTAFTETAEPEEVLDFIPGADLAPFM
jgi:class 3 adenylate cyclase